MWTPNRAKQPFANPLSSLIFNHGEVSVPESEYDEIKQIIKGMSHMFRSPSCCTETCVEKFFNFHKLSNLSCPDRTIEDYAFSDFEINALRPADGDINLYNARRQENKIYIPAYGKTKAAALVGMETRVDIFLAYISLLKTTSNESIQESIYCVFKIYKS
jgi:hypothetical protein